MVSVAGAAGARAGRGRWGFIRWEMAGARACVSVAAAIQGFAGEERPGQCFLAHGEWVCV